MALLTLGACNPIDAWRDMTGVSKNDPNPATTPNTKNLAAGEAGPYPNLATVPPPPTEALTTAELDKLTQSLIADRANAKYTDEKLRAGFSVASAPPPPPPPPLPPPDKPAAAPTPTAAAPSIPATGSKLAAAPAAGAPAAPQGPRKPGEPPEPGPMESSLESPQVPATPPPEQYRPPPPPPHLMTMPSVPAGPSVQATTSAPSAAAHLPAPPAPTSLPGAVGSAAYQPPPPPPVLAPIPTPTRTAVAVGPGKSSVRPAAPQPVFTPVGEIKFAAAATNLSDSDKQTLEKVAALYRQNPGQIRVVGYAGAGNAATDQLGSFRAALDRAQAVAAALAKNGIPSDKILAEAAPAGGQSGDSRAEVLLGH